jgi:hypothetical protein
MEIMLVWPASALRGRRTDGKNRLKKSGLQIRRGGNAGNRILGD